MLRQQTLFQTRHHVGLGQTPADENELRFARLFVCPGTPDVGAHRHVNALNDDAMVHLLERDDGLVTQQVFRMRSNGVTEEVL